MMPYRSPTKISSQRDRRCKMNNTVCFVCKTNIKSADNDIIKCMDDKCDNVKHSYCTGKRYCSECNAGNNKNRPNNQLPIAEKSANFASRVPLDAGVFDSTFVVSSQSVDSPSTVVRKSAPIEEENKCEHERVNEKSLAGISIYSVTTNDKSNGNHNESGSPHTVGRCSEVQSDQHIETDELFRYNACTHTQAGEHVAMLKHIHTLQTTVSNIVTNMNTQKLPMKKCICDDVHAEINEIKNNFNALSANINTQNVANANEITHLKSVIDELKNKMSSIEGENFRLNSRIEAVQNEFCSKPTTAVEADMSEQTKIILTNVLEKLDCMDKCEVATYQNTNSLYDEFNYYKDKTINDAFCKINNNFCHVAAEKKSIEAKLNDLNDMVISNIVLPKSNACDNIDTDSITAVKDEIDSLHDSIAKNSTRVMQVNENLNKMNMQIHKLSSYIIRHSKKISDIESSIIKLTSNHDIQSTEIDSEVLEFFVDSEREEIEQPKN